jgi:hypothetical protein
MGSGFEVPGGRSRGLLVGAALVVVALLGVAVGGASGQTVRAGNLIVTVEGGFSPQKLPRTNPASITLNARSTINTADGAHLPALERLELYFDKNAGVNTKGLPVCTTAKLFNTLTAQARRACPAAIIGGGQAGAEISFPDQRPFLAKAPLVIFNGPPRDGRPVFIFHVHAHVPAPTTFITTAEIAPASGLYGTRVVLEIPTIVAGQGSVNFADLSIHKTWRTKKKKHTLLYASCPNGHFYVRGALTFVDGFEMAGKVVRSCTPSD